MGSLRVTSERPGCDVLRAEYREGAESKFHGHDGISRHENRAPGERRNQRKSTAGSRPLDLRESGARGIHHRELLRLRYVEQLSVAETAAVLQISEAAVKMRHVRALERLRVFLNDQPEER